MTDIGKVANNRQVHPPDNKWIRFGKHFHICVLEKLCLAFIMNLFELHSIEFIGKFTPKQGKT